MSVFVHARGIKTIHPVFLHQIIVLTFPMIFSVFSGLQALWESRVQSELFASSGFTNHYLAEDL